MKIRHVYFSFAPIFISISFILFLAFLFEHSFIKTIHAANFTVNSMASNNDANPGDGICETSPGNDVCTLQAAVAETNALLGHDTISIPTGTFLGNLTISDDLTLIGIGQVNTIISGTGDVVTVLSGSAVHIQDLTIRDGIRGLYNSGVLTVTNCVIEQNYFQGYNTNALGAGLFNTGIATLSNTQIISNTAAGDDANAPCLECPPSSGWDGLVYRS